MKKLSNHDKRSLVFSTESLRPLQSRQLEAIRGGLGDVDVETGDNNTNTATQTATQTATRVDKSCWFLCKCA